MKYEENIWYGWNGGECPVHMNSSIHGIYLDTRDARETMTTIDIAQRFDWQRESNFRLVAFRVVKEYREPREFWITLDDGMAWDAMAQAEKHNAVSLNGGSAIIHVREVSE